MTAQRRAHTTLRPAAQQQTVGILEWFHFNDREHVERALAELDALGVTELRTGFSWADWHRPDGPEWFDWLIPRLSEQVTVLPCFVYTPPSVGVMPATSSPPRDIGDYATFIGAMLDRYGDAFEAVELWNEPNNLSEWSVQLDPEWRLFGRMIRRAAQVAQERGKLTVLGGMSPIDGNWLRMMIDYGVLDHIDVVGVHGFPGVWEHNWSGWTATINGVRDLLDAHDLHSDIWITEAGFSTWQHDERAQVRAFLDALASGAGRLYWYSLFDLHPDHDATDGFHLDEREYHFGLNHLDGTPKLLSRLWRDYSPAELDDLPGLNPAIGPRLPRSRPALITGGAGFIGTNLAARLLREGRSVIVYDNLSRPSVERNARWLAETFGERVEFEIEDVRNTYALRRAVRAADEVFHLAAQVAVTSSLDNPMRDFEINVRGTINLLEELRARSTPPPMIFTSTNKVYGDLHGVTLSENGTRYEPADLAVRDSGVDEQVPLDFHSPYGCSKGAADQYVLDYARMYRLPVALFRMSCIYGPHQFGTEDQGWVAHFLIQALKGGALTIYGDGKQVRDILYVEDLVDAFLLAQGAMPDIAGEAFNIGGGPRNTISLLELLDLIEAYHGQPPLYRFETWRPGDQLYYVSDTGKFRRRTGWQPQVDVRTGVKRLYDWLLRANGSFSGAHMRQKERVV